jgi:hypothetical protein
LPSGSLLGDVDAAVGNALPEVLELVDLPDRVHEKALGGELDGAGLLLGLLVHERERPFAGQDDGVEDVRDLLRDAGPQVVGLEQPAVDQGPANPAGRVVAERVLDVVAGRVPDADQHLAQAIGGVLAAGAVDLAVLEDDGALTAGRVEAEGPGPAGLAEEGDEVREGKAGGIADEHDPRALAPSALGRLAEGGEEVRRGGKEDEAAVACIQLARCLAIGSNTPSGLHADAGGHGRLGSLTGWPWSRCRGSSASRARRRR